MVVAFYKFGSVEEASAVEYFKALTRQSAEGIKKSRRHSVSMPGVPAEMLTGTSGISLCQKWYCLIQHAPVQKLHFPNHLADFDET
jgi:hypothetical protein